MEMQPTHSALTTSHNSANSNTWDSVSSRSTTPQPGTFKLRHDLSTPVFVRDSQIRLSWKNFEGEIKAAVENFTSDSDTISNQSISSPSPTIEKGEETFLQTDELQTSLDPPPTPPRRPPPLVHHDSSSGDKDHVTTPPRRPLPLAHHDSSSGDKDHDSSSGDKDHVITPSLRPPLLAHHDNLSGDKDHLTTPSLRPPPLAHHDSSTGDKDHVTTPSLRHPPLAHHDNLSGDKDHVTTPSLRPPLLAHHDNLSGDKDQVTTPSLRPPPLAHHDNLSGDKDHVTAEENMATNLMSDKLALDLNSIMPSFDFDFTSFGSNPMFSSSSESESHASKESLLSDFEAKEPRHSWAGSNLEIIDTSTLDLQSTLKSNEYHRNSFDLLFRRKKSDVKGLENFDNCRHRFESDSPSSTIGEFVCRKNPLMRYLAKTLRHSTELVLEDERVIVKFKGRNDYLCSSVGLMQKKVILHLLDVVNVLVLYGSSTLVIQFRQSSKTKSIKERSKLYRLSGIARSSNSLKSNSLKSNSLKSSSLSRSISSESDQGEISQLEVGQFPECLHIASLILKQKQSLLPRSILKRCSGPPKAVEPIVVMPLELTCLARDEVMEWMTNV